MNKIWVTHLPDFLNEAGSIPEGLPLPARRLAEALCNFVVLATNIDGEDDELPCCFVLVNRKRCQGKVDAFLAWEDDRVIWECRSCGSYGTISGWQGTLWDLSEGGTLQ